MAWNFEALFSFCSRHAGTHLSSRYCAPGPSVICLRQNIELKNKPPGNWPATVCFGVRSAVYLSGLSPDPGLPLRRRPHRVAIGPKPPVSSGVPAKASFDQTEPARFHVSEKFSGDPAGRAKQTPGAAKAGPGVCVGQSACGRGGYIRSITTTRLPCSRTPSAVGTSGRVSPTASQEIRARPMPASVIVWITIRARFSERA